MLAAGIFLVLAGT